MLLEATSRKEHRSSLRQSNKPGYHPYYLSLGGSALQWDQLVWHLELYGLSSGRRNSLKVARAIVPRHTLDLLTSCTTAYRCSVRRTPNHATVSGLTGNSNTFGQHRPAAGSARASGRHHRLSALPDHHRYITYPRWARRRAWPSIESQPHLLWPNSPADGTPLRPRALDNRLDHARLWTLLSVHHLPAAPLLHGTQCAHDARRGAFGYEAFGNFNDPSAGSPTETLLRLLLPLNDQVWLSSSRKPQKHLRAPTATIRGPC